MYYVYMCLWLYTMCMRVLMEARKCWIPWSWCYKWFWATWHRFWGLNLDAGNKWVIFAALVKHELKASRIQKQHWTEVSHSKSMHLWPSKNKVNIRVNYLVELPAVSQNNYVIQTNLLISLNLCFLFISKSINSIYFTDIFLMNQ